MEIAGSLPHSQQPTTCPYRSQIKPFLCPSNCWQLLRDYVLVGLKTYQHRGINFFCTFNASKIFIKFINNLVIRQHIQGNTWDWIKPNISPQLTSRWNKHRTGVASFLLKYKCKGKGLYSVLKWIWWTTPEQNSWVRHCCCSILHTKWRWLPKFLKQSGRLGTQDSWMWTVT